MIQQIKNNYNKFLFNLCGCCFLSGIMVLNDDVLVVGEGCRQLAQRSTCLSA